jgi:DMSO/TMAO reductase YedYZ molybdopterin-dependent catalytic subunit
MNRDGRVVRLVFLALALCALLTGLAGCGVKAPDVTWELVVDGAVSTPLTLSFQDLVKMPQTELKEVVMQRSSGDPTTSSWSGVALTEIFKKAGVASWEKGITAVANDGYAISIPKDELEGGIVALKMEGEWIETADYQKGPIRLVCPQTPANRWVFQLKQITIN